MPEAVAKRAARSLSRIGPLARLASSLRRRRVRFVLIGVSGANFYASHAGLAFHTEDHDLFLPLDARNERRAWEACSDAGFDLWVGDEPLDVPRDEALAREIVKRRALVRATREGGPAIDLTLVMAGFTFPRVYAERRTFRVDGVRVDVARLRDIVVSKAAAGRPKDRLFLAAHEEALAGLLQAKRPRPAARKRRRSEATAGKGGGRGAALPPRAANRDRRGGRSRRASRRRPGPNRPR